MQVAYGFIHAMHSGCSKGIFLKNIKYTFIQVASQSQ